MTIIFSKESEFQWIKSVIDNGIINLPEEYRREFKMAEIPTKQSIQYVRSTDYVDDCPEIPYPMDLKPNLNRNIIYDIAQ